MFPPNNTPAPAGATPGQTAQASGDQNPQANDFASKADFNTVAKYVRGLTEKIEALSKNTPTTDLFVQLGILEKADDGTLKPRAIQTSPKAPEKQAEPEWKSAVEELKKTLKSKEDELNAERNRTAEVEKKTAVISALVKGGAINPERDAVHILSAVQKNDAGEFISRTKDEIGLDAEMTLENFAAKFLESNPELKKATGHAGSGTPAGAGRPGGNTINRDQVSPEWYAKNRDKIVSGEIQIV